MVADQLNDDRTERFAVVPVTTGEVGSSSRSDVTETSQRRQLRGDKGVRMRKGFGFLAPKVSNGIRRFIRALKSFCLIFVYKEAEEEKEMEIGFPTDVKHLTHIGCDGTTTTNQIKGWENLRGPELIASASISLKQFELAMAAQAADQLHHQTSTVYDLDESN